MHLKMQQMQQMQHLQVYSKDDVIYLTKCGPVDYDDVITSVCEVGYDVCGCGCGCTVVVDYSSS